MLDDNKKCHFSPNLGDNFIFFFFEVLALLDVRHCPKLQSCAISRKTTDATLRKWLVVRQYSKLSSMQFPGKLMNQILENSPKTNFGPDFDLFGPNLGPKNVLVGFTSTSS